MDYAEKQTRWLRKNKLKTGSLVKVVRITDRVKGWGNLWCTDMNNWVGRTFKLREFCDCHGKGVELVASDCSSFRFPYTCLKPVKMSAEYLRTEKEEARKRDVEKVRRMLAEASRILDRLD